jgi:hypothetical protein
VAETLSDEHRNGVTLLHLLLSIGMFIVPVGAEETVRHAKLGIVWCAIAAILGLVAGVLNGWAVWGTGRWLYERNKQSSKRRQEWIANWIVRGCDSVDRVQRFSQQLGSVEVGRGAGFTRCVVW